METAHKKARSIKPIVEKYLREKPDYRDSDEMLVARYWADEFVSMGGSLDGNKARTFLAKLKAGELTSFDSITRAKRKVQEQIPELRGETWNTRHGLAEDFKNNAHTI